MQVEIQGSTCVACTGLVPTVLELAALKVPVPSFLAAKSIQALHDGYLLPWVPPRTGSKRYQRRRAQRWPKGK